MHDVIITPKGQNIQNPKTGEADMLGPQKICIPANFWTLNRMVTLNFQNVQYFDPMHDVIITPKGQNIQNPRTGEADMLGPSTHAFQLKNLDTSKLATVIDR